MADLNSIEGLKEAVQQLFAELRNTPPVSTIILLGSEKTPPQGYLLCDGTEYSIIEHPEYEKLFNEIGNTWGGDGNGTFSVPDCRGEFFRGLDKGRGVDSDRIIGTKQSYATALPISNRFITESSGIHRHNIANDGIHNHYLDLEITASRNHAGGAINTVANPHVGGARKFTEMAGAHSHEMSDSGIHEHAIIGGDSETRPGNIALIAYIKY